MGNRRLAYEIQDLKEGHYYLVNFTAETDGPREIERILRILDGILRFLIIRKRLMSHRRVSQFYESSYIIGTFSRDPELRTTQMVRRYSFTLAIDRRFKNQYGERQTDFIVYCVE